MRKVQREREINGISPVSLGVARRAGFQQRDIALKSSVRRRRRHGRLLERRGECVRTRASLAGGGTTRNKHVNGNVHEPHHTQTDKHTAPQAVVEET